MASSPAGDVPFEGDDAIRDHLERFSNGGRWGEGDQPDAPDHVVPGQVRAAAALVRQGKVISLGLPLALDGPQSGGLWANPLNTLTATGTVARPASRIRCPAGSARRKASASPTTCLFSAVPLPITGATGSPVNPVAVT